MFSCWVHQGKYIWGLVELVQQVITWANVDPGLWSPYGVTGLQWVKPRTIFGNWATTEFIKGPPLRKSHWWQRFQCTESQKITENCNIWDWVFCGRKWKWQRIEQKEIRSVIICLQFASSKNIFYRYDSWLSINNWQLWWQKCRISMA